MWGNEWDDRETCTTCRAIYAENCISRWRTSVQPSDAFSRQVAAIRCGIFANLLGPSFDPMSMFGLAREFLGRNGATTVEVMTAGEWSHKKKVTTIRPMRTASFWHLKTTRFLQPMTPDFEIMDLLLGVNEGLHIVSSRIVFEQQANCLTWEPKQWRDNPESKKKKFEFSANDLLPDESFFDPSVWMAYVPAVVTALAEVDVISLRTAKDDWRNFFDDCFVTLPGTGRPTYTPRS